MQQPGTQVYPWGFTPVSTIIPILPPIENNNCEIAPVNEFIIAAFYKLALTSLNQGVNSKGYSSPSSFN